MSEFPQPTGCLKRRSETRFQTDAARGATLRSIAAVLLVAGSAWLASCSSAQPGHAVAEKEAPRTQKADLTAVAPAMMVGRESFPADAVGNWRAPYMYEDYSGEGSDQGCAPLLENWEHLGDSHVLTSLDASADPEHLRELRYRMDLILPKNEDHPDVVTVVDACPTLELNGSTLQVQRESVSGIPSWATAYTVNGSDASGSHSVSNISGHFRGIDINVSAARNNSSPVAADMTDLAKLFNDQVAKLESQP